MCPDESAATPGHTTAGPRRDWLSAMISALRSRPFLAAKLLIFLAAGISFVLSVSLWFSGSEQTGIFVGIWVPSILSAGTLLLSDGIRR